MGMLAGYGLLVALLGGFEVAPGSIVPIEIVGNPQAWVRVHIGTMMNGFLVLIVASLLPVLAYGEKATGRIAWALIGTGWANALFYWAALFAPNRALTIGPNRFGASNVASLVGLLPAFLFIFISCLAIGAIAYRAFSVTSKPAMS